MTCSGKKVTIDGKDYLLVNPDAIESADGVVLIRTQSAGVHVGTLKHREGMIVTLTGARRVWRWRGANTLHELSQRGAAQEYTRISESVPQIVLEAIEVISCSKVGAADLQKSRWGA